MHVGCVIKNICMYRAPEAQKMDNMNTFLFDPFSREINDRTRTPRDVGWDVPTGFALTIGNRETFEISQVDLPCDIAEVL